MNKTSIMNLVNKKNPVIFEIGCADGKDTEEFLATFNNEVEIHCFEPEPKNISIVESRAFPKNHHLFRGVMSDVDGQIIFNRSRTDNPEDLSYSGSIKKPIKHLDYWPQIKFDQQILIDSITLDTYCKQKEISLIDFIWADVQGAEENLISGGKITFQDKVRFFYTEYSNEELYENQSSLSRILDLLGPSWQVLHDFKTDVLLKNTRL